MKESSRWVGGRKEKVGRGSRARVTRREEGQRGGGVGGGGGGIQHIR